MVGASDIKSSWSPHGLLVMSEMFLCTLSPEDSWGRTCLVQCCLLHSHLLGLNPPKLCPVQPLVTPKPVPALWEWQCCGQGRGWQGTDRGVWALPALGTEWEQRFLHCGWPKHWAVPSADGQMFATGMSHSLAAPHPPATCWGRSLKGAVTLCLCRFSSFVSQVFSPHA